MSALTSLVRALCAGEAAAEGAFADAFAEVTAGAAAPAEAGALLGALAARLRSDDAVAFVRACRRAQPLVPVGGHGRPSVNLVGTGGGRSTFNVSTTTAFVLAAAGVTVVKTGSSAYSSRSGFAETAAALGVLRNLEWPALVEVAERVGLVLVPPSRYPPVLGTLAATIKPASMKAVGGFVNAIGPLLAPVAVDHRVLGASTERLFALLTDAAQALGDLPAHLVYGEEGLDEAATIGLTRVRTVDAAGVRTWLVDARELPLAAVGWDDLAGLDPMASARLVQTILAGRGSPQQTDLVALNAAVTLRAVGAAGSLDLKGAFRECRALLEKGAAGEVLGKLRAALQNR